MKAHLSCLSLCGLCRGWGMLGKQNIHHTLYLYFYRLKTQRPHSITDDIIKLLNEITVPVDQRLFSRAGLHNEITLQTSAHTGGRPSSPNRAAVAKAHWSRCRLHTLYFNGFKRAPNVILNKGKFGVL